MPAWVDVKKQWAVLDSERYTKSACGSFDLTDRGFILATYRLDFQRTGRSYLFYAAKFRAKALPSMRELLRMEWFSLQTGEKLTDYQVEASKGGPFVQGEADAVSNWAKHVALGANMPLPWSKEYFRDREQTAKRRAEKLKKAAAMRERNRIQEAKHLAAMAKIAADEEKAEQEKLSAAKLAVKGAV